MSLFVDTSVWSLAFRRDRTSPAPEVRALRNALEGGDTVLTTGLILQELLQGFSGPRARKDIVDRFAALPLLPPDRQDYIDAAELRNRCRRAGLQIGTIDAVLAQLCIRHTLTLLTTDNDFTLAAAHCPLRVWGRNALTSVSGCAKTTERGDTTMAEARKVIITCAITGSIHTPSMSPHLPVTPREIADAAVAAAEAGAAIVHLHARDPVDGHPTQDPKYFREFAPDIKRRSNVVLNFTTGGAATMTIEERLQPALQMKPEVASLNMGSMNFGLYPMLKRFKEFKYGWEREYLEGSDSRIFRNTFKDIEYILTSCADNGTRFEIECYDIGHLYTAHHFFERGIVKPPLFIQSVFGILGGIGPHPEDVDHMKRTADRLFGDQYRWSVLGAGRNQLPIGAMSAAMGGNVRVGLEDSLWLGPGKLAESNAAQVRAARQIIEGLGLAIATPDDARKILALKGGANVAF